MALFHSALALTKGNEKQSADNSGDDGADVNRRCSNQRLWLHLGIDDANPKLNSAFRVPCELHVAHFNHEQRGDSSEGDEEFVRNICMQNKIPFHSYSWSEEDRSLESTPLPTPEIANGDDRYDAPNETTNDTANFTQDVARKWRQRKLKELLSCLVVTSKATSCPGSRWGAILTAHHRDDADETILLKLLRGSHLTNLSSMDARSDEFDLRLGRDDEMKNDALAHPPSHSFTSIGYFAKPMLKLRKKHIMKYLTSNSLEWREDDSNNSNKYKRNKIRNELLPLLSEITGGDRALQVRVSPNRCQIGFSSTWAEY
jgi:tRNA(Ile)-lysidine synthase